MQDPNHNITFKGDTPHFKTNQILCYKKATWSRSQNNFLFRKGYLTLALSRGQSKSRILLRFWAEMLLIETVMNMIIGMEYQNKHPFYSSLPKLPRPQPPPARNFGNFSLSKSVKNNLGTGGGVPLPKFWAMSKRKGVFFWDFFPYIHLDTFRFLLLTVFDLSEQCIFQSLKTNLERNFQLQHFLMCVDERSHAFQIIPRSFETRTFETIWLMKTVDTQSNIISVFLPLKAPKDRIICSISMGSWT